MSAAEPVRLALIGAGRIGQRHAQVASNLPGCAFVAIADPDPGAAGLAATHGTAFYQNIEEMLDSEKPDGVIVAVPTPLHEPVGTLLAARRVHMLVEKPITADQEGAGRLIAAAAATGTRILVGHHRRHNPVVAAARKIIADGEIGKLIGASLIWAVLKPRSYFDVLWRRSAGAGPILTNLIHDVDLLQFICGPITAVSSITGNAARGFEIEDAVAATLTFGNGAVGSLLATDAAPSPWSWDANTGENPTFAVTRENSYRFLGTEGSLEFPDLHLWRYRIAGEPGWEQPLSREGRIVPPEDAYVRQLRHFCDVVRGDAEPVMSGEDAAHSLAATLALIESAATGRTIHLSPASAPAT